MGNNETKNNIRYGIIDHGRGVFCLKMSMVSKMVSKGFELQNESK